MDTLIHAQTRTQPRGARLHPQAPAVFSVAKAGAAGPRPLTGSPEGSTRIMRAPRLWAQNEGDKSSAHSGPVGRAYCMSTEPGRGAVMGTPPGERMGFTPRQSSLGTHGANARHSTFTCPPSSKRHPLEPPPPCGGLHGDPRLCRALTPKPEWEASLQT